MAFEWSRAEIEAVAERLARDLGTAGPRFSIRLTETSPTVHRLKEMIHSADLGPAPYLGEPAETAIAVLVDGSEDHTLVFWSGLDPIDHLEGLLDQAQDFVMESTREQWPLCPQHRHELHARAAGDHIEWQCSDTGRAFARFGELAEAGLA